jgi:cytochrome c oxidase subunit 3
MADRDAAEAGERAPATVEHFQDLATQAHAAHLGMWIFLGSEALLFAGLFALYAGYRAHYPDTFAHGVHENARLLGSLNTLVLLTSSWTAALAVHQARRDRGGRAAALFALTVLAGAGFLVIKSIEYRKHFHEGVYPGGSAPARARMRRRARRSSTRSTS